MLRDFRYSLEKLGKADTVELNGKFDGMRFRYDCRTEGTNIGVRFIVTSEIIVDLNGYKVFGAISEYSIPAEQYTPSDISNDIYCELIYQHLSRESERIYAITHGQVPLTIPTMRQIMDVIAAPEN